MTDAHNPAEKTAEAMAAVIRDCYRRSIGHPDQIAAAIVAALPSSAALERQTLTPSDYVDQRVFDEAVSIEAPATTACSIHSKGHNVVREEWAVRLRHAVTTLTSELVETRAQRDALQAFKEYVHQRLDEAHIPTHPDGEHSAAGCRIGDRLDIALSAMQRLAQNERISTNSGDGGYGGPR